MKQIRITCDGNASSGRILNHDGAPIHGCIGAVITVLPNELATAVLTFENVAFDVVAQSDATVEQGKASMEALRLKLQK